MFLEVKIFKNLNPKAGFHPNFFFKIHYFVVISHIDRMSCSTSVASVTIYGNVHSLRPMNGPLCHHLCDLLLKKHEFWKKCSGRKPLSGSDFFDFSLPKYSPQHGELAGVKISKFQKVVIIVLLCNLLLLTAVSSSSTAKILAPEILVICKIQSRYKW